MAVTAAAKIKAAEAKLGHPIGKNPELGSASAARSASIADLLDAVRIAKAHAQQARRRLRSLEKLRDRAWQAWERDARRQQRLAAIGEMAAGIAHEIRNPLTVMKLLYHSLNLEFPSADPRRRDAEIIGEKMDHLNRIVEKILAFARSAEPEFHPVDINRLIEDLGLLLRHKLQQQGVDGVIRLAPGLPKVQADAAQMEQVFLNLSLNALQAMPEGGELTLSTSVSDGRVTVEVRDTGEIGRAHV